MLNWLQQFYSNHVNEFIGAELGIIISIVIWLCSRLLKIFMNWRRYQKYSGDYISYLKQHPDKKQFEIKLIRHGNKFKVIGLSLLKNEPIEGEIEMSTSIKNYGTGYYSHVIPDQTKPQRFGFYELQLAQKHIFVHQNIKGLTKDDIGEDKSAAYVWVKQKNSR